MNNGTQRFGLAALLALGVGACGDDASVDGADDAVGDAGIEADVADAGASADVSEGSGASGDEWGVVTDFEPYGSPLFVAKTLEFIRESPGQVSDGFDLDGRVSNEQDLEGCRIGDFTNERGDEGIDNQFARLVPLIEAAGGSALPGLVQSAINEGDLLVMIDVEGLDDWQNDDNFSITVMRGRGETFVGTDGFLLPNLSFDIDTNEPMSTVENVQLIDGVAEAGPFEVQLPIFVFDFRFDVTLIGGRVRLEMREDGTAYGLMGGAVTIENVLDIADTPGIQGRIPDLIESLGATMADLTVNEPCDAFSATVGFELVPAFAYAEPPDELPPTEAPAGDGDEYEDGERP